MHFAAILHHVVKVMSALEQDLTYLFDTTVQTGTPTTDIHQEYFDGAEYSSDLVININLIPVFCDPLQRSRF